MKLALQSAAVLAVLTLACPLVWAADPAIVFVDEARARAKAIMVMDADGGNRREVFRTEKRFCDCGGPTLSPSISPDGEWVTYVKAEGDEGQGYAIYKIPVAGGVPEKLLCSVGPGHLIFPDAPQWSPDGTVIAAHTIDYIDGVESVIVLPRNGIGCGTLPEVIYSSDDSPTSYWQLYAGVTWNQDSSQIALLEVDLEALVDYLTIVDRNSGDVVNRHEVAWPPGFVGGNVDMELYGLDWQQSGTLDFAFSTGSESTTPAEIVWLLSVNEAGLAVATELAQGESPTWSPDDSQLLIGASRFWGAPEDMTLVTVATGGTELLGTGYAPDWARGSVTVCGDGSCNGAENQCSCAADCGAPELFENPDSPTMCTDGIDNDCDGNIDANDPTFCCPDADSDGFTSDICGGPDCNDVDPSIHPGAGESCSSGVDDDCDGATDCFDSDCFLDPICEPEPVDCSQFSSKRSCKAEPTCRWNNRNKVCLPR